jgi:hypothetical protein
MPTSTNLPSALTTATPEGEACSSSGSSKMRLSLHLLDTGLRAPKLDMNTQQEVVIVIRNCLITWY